MTSKKPLVVIALGGNAILRKGERGYVEEQWRNIKRAAEAIVGIYERGYRIVVTHGNGPQIGSLMELFELGKERIPPLTMDIASAMTQAWIGYMLQLEIGNLLEEKGFERRVVTIINTVSVDPRDKAFEEPTKFIGPFYTLEEAKKLSYEKKWVFKEDPRGGWRRVVASPQPLANNEIEAIKTLVEKDFIVIASGGGGVPVARIGRRLHGVEAVIDKDLASALLAINLGADKLVILTDVDGAYLNYGKPNATLLERISVEEAKKLLREGVFGEGSMKPKIEAAIRFTEATGRESIIGNLDKALEVIYGRGTVITP
ncbi:MAG: carbamate kinase [Sulfolobales archaeon]